MSDGETDGVYGRESLIIDALAEPGWSPSDTQPGLDEKILWAAAPGYASIALLRFAKGAGIGSEHRHASNQFMYCLSGRYRYRSSGATLVPGSFYWNPRGHAHGPTEAMEDTVLIEIYDGQHYEAPPDRIDGRHRLGDRLAHTNRLTDVWETTLEAGQSATHDHRFPYVMIAIDAGDIEIADADGGMGRRHRLAAGETRFAHGDVAHTVRNVGDAALRYRVVEFKSPPPGRATGCAALPDSKG